MAEPKNESLHLLLSLFLVFLLFSLLLFYRVFSSTVLWLLPRVAPPFFLFLLFLRSRYSPLVAGPRAPFLVSRSFTFGITWRTCMHACISKRGWLNSVQARVSAFLLFAEKRTAAR